MQMASSFLDDGNSLFKFVVQDGNGVKGLSDLALPKVPEQYVQPPHERIDKENTMSDAHPPIDLSKLDGTDHDQVVEEIARAAETIGFFQVVNHGVPLELLHSLKVAAHNFFGQPAETKAAYRTGSSPSPSVKYGTSFLPDKERALEWKDFIHMTYTNDAEALQYWPTECKDVALEYLKKSTKFVRKIVQILIGKLGVELDDAKIDGLIGQKVVQMNLYPPCPNPEVTVGVGRHSDISMLTVLLQDDIGGLYIKMEEDADQGVEKGDWVEIPPLPGALVLNVGDMLQILSNGKYKSAEHRVRASSTKSRVSLPCFFIPKKTERIGPLPQAVARDGVACYQEFLLGDYMNNYLSKAHDGKKSLDFARISTPSQNN